MIIKYNKILSYIFLFFALFPFVSPYPINTDTQPVSLFFALIIFLLNFNKFNKYKFFLIFIILFLIYINPFYLNEYEFHYEYRKIFSIIGGIIIFISLSISLKYLNGKFLFFVTSLYFIMDLLIYINPDFFLHLQSFVIRENNVTNIFGSRGIAPFSTEPGLFAGMMIGFLLINDYLYEQNKQKKIFYMLIYLEIIFMIIMSKSGTGYILLFLYFLLKNFSKISFKSIFIIISIFIFIFYIIFNLNLNNRGIEILKYLFENPVFYMQHDLSIYTRIYSILIGIKSLFNNVLGYGVFDINYFLYYDIILKNEILYSFPKGPTIENLYLVSGFSYISSIYGMLGIIFLIYLFFFSKAKLINKIFAFIFLSVSYSISFPLIWILLSLNKEKQ